MFSIIVCHEVVSLNEPCPFPTDLLYPEIVSWCYFRDSWHSFVHLMPLSVFCTFPLEIWTHQKSSCLTLFSSLSLSPTSFFVLHVRIQPSRDPGLPDTQVHSHGLRTWHFVLLCRFLLHPSLPGLFLCYFFSFCPGSVHLSHCPLFSSSMNMTQKQRQKKHRTKILN